MEYTDKSKNIRIIADSIEISEGVTFGNNIDICVKGCFKIGDYSRLGSNTHIRGNNITFGKHLFNSSGLNIGGGGRQYPNANFRIGDRCTIHNNFINVCEPVEIGDDVGLSTEVSILTHGYWLSVLEGHPATFKGVKIGNEVIVGYRSLIIMGVNICDDIVIGAQSTVTKSIKESGIYAGVPVRLLSKRRSIEGEAERRKKVEEIIEGYNPIALYHGIKPEIKLEYPIVYIRGFAFNVETFEAWGDEDDKTDDFRDYIRKYGIRIYTKRPFISKF